MIASKKTTTKKYATKNGLFFNTNKRKIFCVVCIKCTMNEGKLNGIKYVKKHATNLHHVYVIA